MFQQMGNFNLIRVSVEGRNYFILGTQENTMNYSGLLEWIFEIHGDSGCNLLQVTTRINHQLVDGTEVCRNVVNLE